MTTATAPKAPEQEHRKYDPDQFRMTIGEHLEELRWRLILALIGFVIALGVCLAFGEHVIVIICKPLIDSLKSEDLATLLTYSKITDPFMVYLQTSVIAAAAIAGPWMIYQLWLFIAAGLYPNERKTITRYIPLSLTLFITGVLFVYFLVLPLTLRFFLHFSSGLPLPIATNNQPVEVPAAQHVKLPQLMGDLAKPEDGDMWFNIPESRLKVFLHGHIRVLNFAPANLLAPHLTLPDYIDLVITFMLTFGLSFQLPLVVLALVRVGIVDIAFLKKQRRMVYFIMAVVSAFVAPGDVVASMLSLLIPLMILYEFGLWLAARAMKRVEAERAAEEA